MVYQLSYITLTLYTKASKGFMRRRISDFHVFIVFEIYCKLQCIFKTWMILKIKDKICLSISFIVDKLYKKSEGPKIWIKLQLRCFQALGHRSHMLCGQGRRSTASLKLGKIIPLIRSMQWGPIIFSFCSCDKNLSLNTLINSAQWLLFPNSMEK